MKQGVDLKVTILFHVKQLANGTR